MRSPRPFGIAIVAAAAVGLAAQSGPTFAQATVGRPRTDAFVESMDHPAVSYTTGSVHNAGADLNDRIRSGAVKLAVDPANGYLRSVLDALHIPIDSQTLVFSQGSMQASQISPSN